MEVPDLIDASSLSSKASSGSRGVSIPLEDSGAVELVVVVVVLGRKMEDVLLVGAN